MKWRESKRAVCLLCAVALSSQAAAQAAAQEAIVGRWDGEGLQFELRLATAPDLASNQEPVGDALLMGIVGIPVGAALMGPIGLIVMPVFAVVAPLLQWKFNTQIGTLARVFAADSPASAIVDAVRSGWLASPVRPTASAQMSLLSYGLASQSGAKLTALGRAELLCLVAAAQLDWQRDAAEARSERLLIGVAQRSPDAPPPVCLDFGVWADDDGAALRTRLRELGAVLGAMAVDRIAAQP
jgi:hypothetical protein